MKIAIFGDIHANLEGLEAVLQDAADRDCTHFVCIGDIVGYNANPHECLEVVRQLDCPVVKGNHDEEAALDTDLVGLNPLAERAMQWTDRIYRETVGHHPLRKIVIGEAGWATSKVTTVLGGTGLP